MYNLNFDPETIEFLKGLDETNARRIWNKIQTTKENPFHFFVRLTGRQDYKLRVGDYRVIADIDNAKKLINITRIGHRKNIYKNI